MKRPFRRRNRDRHTGVDGETNSTSSYCDSGGRSDASVETDLTEPDPSERPAKRSKWVTSHRIRNLSPDKYAGDFSDDPLDDTGRNLSDIPKDYDKSEGYKDRKSRMEARWGRYCKAKVRELPLERKWRDPEEALRRASDNDVFRFLGWCLTLTRGADGRRLRGFGEASSLQADWRSFRTYYESVTTKKLNGNDSKEVRRGLKFLADERGLGTQERPKIPVYIEDMIPFNETILSTPEKRFWLGFQRVQVCLYNTLGIFTLHRKGALLGLQYKHLQFSLQRDPRGGPPIPLVELTAEATKKFLGLTKVITFPLPEVIYGPSLVFCPHTFLFGMLFHAGAFKTPGLTSMAELRKMWVTRGCQQLLLPLKSEMADWYVFCRTEVVKGVPVIQRKQPMSPQTMGRLLTTFGEIHGFLRPFFSHQFRYGGGKILNESGWVSEEQRMLIMKHADRRTFIDHYHPRTIDTDMIRTLCGLDPDTELMRSVTRLSRWRDQRRPRHLTTEDKERIKDHPDLEEARQKFDTVTAKYRQTGDPDLAAQVQRREREVKNTETRLLRALRTQIRQEFDENQHVLDGAAQLSGTIVEESVDESPSEVDMHPLQLQLLEKLLTYPTSGSLEAEWERRNEAVAAVVQYCDVLEGGPLVGRPKRTASKPVATGGETGKDFQTTSYNADGEKKVCEPSQDELLNAHEKHKKNSKKSRTCFQCFSDKKLPDNVRCKRFYDSGCLTRHFDARHLEDERCNWCEVSLLHKMHVQRHAKDVHDVHSRFPSHCYSCS